MKTFIGNFLLAKKLKHQHREKHFSGLKQSVSVGILFDASSSSDNVIIKNLVKDLRQQGKDARVLGYVNHRNKDPQYISDGHNAYISKQDFNWLNQPKDPLIDEFISKKFDILLVLTYQNWFPVHYISSLSQAHFKVGKSGISEPNFDLTLEMAEITPLEEQVSQMMRYLNMISQ